MNTDFVKIKKGHLTAPSGQGTSAYEPHIEGFVHRNQV